MLHAGAIRTDVQCPVILRVVALDDGFKKRAGSDGPPIPGTLRGFWAADERVWMRTRFAPLFALTLCIGLARQAVIRYSPVRVAA